MHVAKFNQEGGVGDKSSQRILWFCQTQTIMGLTCYNCLNSKKFVCC